jgi:predicted DCC family thiol-disulfide oxidoreductase YuxK
MTCPPPTTDVTAAPASLRREGEPPVIFFDGVCGLCNRSVDFVMSRDRRRQFRFAPLQGETAREWLNIGPSDDYSSMVLVDNTGTYRQSDAVARVLRRLGGLWTVCGWLLFVVPRPLRNWGYALVARNRYRWFGKKESCRLPTPDQRALFLP